MLKYFLLTFGTLSLCLFISCKKSPTAPEEIKPGSRDYEWKVDTFPSTPYNPINRIWADAEDNIWAVAPPGDGDKVLWHFDGSSWQLWPAMFAFRPWSIYGTGKNNLWVGGIGSILWHFDGSQWKIFKQLSIEGHLRMSIENFYGENPNDIYAIGTAFSDSGNDYRAAILHFDGKDWTSVDLKGFKAILWNICKDSRINNLYFIRGLLDTDHGELCKVFTFDGTKLKEIYSAPDSYTKTAWVCQLDKDVYIIIDQKIYKYQNEQLVLWKDFSGTIFQGIIWGRSEKDFFFNSKNNGIGHYNGSNLITIYPNYVVSNAAILERSVIFQSFDYAKGNNLIFKGTLK